MILKNLWYTIRQFFIQLVCDHPDMDRVRQWEATRYSICNHCGKVFSE